MGAQWRELIDSDVARYVYMLDRDGTAMIGRPGGRLRKARAVLMCQGLQASIVYRLGHALVTWEPQNRSGQVARAAGRVLHFGANKVMETTAGIWIAERAEIGPGLYIGHFSGIFITSAKLGANCNLSQGVTIGESGRDGRGGTPQLGDRVWVGPGAVITGPVQVGDDAVVGANAVVTKDVPNATTAVPAPIRLIPGGSQDMVLYPGMDSDPARGAQDASGH